MDSKLRTTGSDCEKRRPQFAGWRLWCCTFLCAVPAAGCRLSPCGLDFGAVRRARLGFEEYYEKYPIGERPPEAVAEKAPSLGTVVLGELIAIFPGFLVHGLGHFYAGDNDTGKKLFRIGQTGYLFAGVGAGLCAGAYFLDEADEDDHWNGFVYSLYGAGGLSGLVGVGFLLSAWVFDVIDTPRAIYSGGQPPPRSGFVESMDIFE